MGNTTSNLKRNAGAAKHHHPNHLTLTRERKERILAAYERHFGTKPNASFDRARGQTVTTDGLEGLYAKREVGRPAFTVRPEDWRES